MKNFSPFHLVEYSPWPILASMGAMFMVSGLASWFHGYDNYLFLGGLVVVVLTAYSWWRDVVSEGTYGGFHTSNVMTGLRIGMILFIVSEVCFFFAFFWAFFHSSLVPTVEVGATWPPRGVVSLSPFGVPLLNTVVLLSSGVTVTWCHHSLLCGARTEALISLFLTCCLGAYFTVLQAQEYFETSFSISDSVYGSTFFVATGFHGLHVLIGTSCLVVCLGRLYYVHYSWTHHVGFEASAWYWHFVDVVWLFLYVFIYWWGH